MPRAEGGAVASLDGSTLHVMYLSMFGVPYEQSLDLNTATPDQRSWRTDGVHRLPALGQPLGRTVYNRHGDVFGWACFALALGVTGVRRVRAKRRLHTGGGIG